MTESESESARHRPSRRRRASHGGRGPLEMATAQASARVSRTARRQPGKAAPCWQSAWANSHVATPKEILVLRGNCASKKLSNSLTNINNTKESVVLNEERPGPRASPRGRHPGRALPGQNPGRGGLGIGPCHSARAAAAGTQRGPRQKGATPRRAPLSASLATSSSMGPCSSLSRTQRNGKPNQDSPT